MSYFENNMTKLLIKTGSETLPGLRNPQVGAIHAISSYFTIASSEHPAIVVMPTGSGKTAVLMMAPYILEAKRVLVLTPSILVRGQIVEEYQSLNTLKSARCFDDTIQLPSVIEIKQPCHSQDEANQLAQYDVVVSTPNSLYKSLEYCTDDLFDLLLIDEAHHAPADTWKSIITHFAKAKNVFFTATPFRTDKKEIKGEIIYNYPLSFAYRDKIFGEIEYHPVEDFEPEKRDIEIALKAQRIFLHDREQGLDHYLMVRTNTKTHATQLEDIYKTNTSLKLMKIDSSKTVKHIKTVVQKLKEKELDGVICVDMLGEGFDFPNLKIAAIHEPHKSLAITLQFIGRFARTNARSIGKAKFIAIADDKIKIENQHLYESDAIWQDIIIDLSERKSAEEIVQKEFFSNFSEIQMHGPDSPISLVSLNPYFHVKIFHVEKFVAPNKFEIDGQETVHLLINEESNTVIAVTRTLFKPKWIITEEVMDVKYFLYIIYYDSTNKHLFIHSPFRTNIFYDELANRVSVTEPKRIPKYKIHKVLANLNEIEFFNTGMQNRYATTGETYRILAGPNTEKAIDVSTGRMFANGHVFCKAKNGQEEVTIGYSSGSKVWSNQYDRIPKFISWCRQLSTKMNSDAEVKTNTNIDFLPIGRPLTKFPDGVFMCHLNAQTYFNPPIVRVGEVNLSQGLLDMDLIVDYDNSTQDKIVIIGNLMDVTFAIEYLLSGNFEWLTEPANEITIRVEQQDMTLLHYFNIYPVELRTVDDTAVIEHELLVPPSFDFNFNPNQVINIDWNSCGTNINDEFTGKNSIHNTLEMILRAEPVHEVIIKDHGTGEMADFITIREITDRTIIQLFHVKAANGKPSNDRVDDVYEVCGQAIKSLMWVKSRGVFRQNLDRRTRDKPHKYIKGDHRLALDRILNTRKTLRFEIFVVQPGLTSDLPISEKVGEVLAATSHYISSSGIVEKFLIWGSSVETT